MKHVCRICLKVINDLNYVALKTDKPSQIKTELLFCVPEMVVDLVKDPVFCKSCVSALHSAYNFKNLCISTEEHIKNLKISYSKSINVMDSLYDLLQSTNGVCEDNGQCKNTGEGFVITPNTNILLSDEDFANGQNLNTKSQHSVTFPVDSFNKIINANNVTSNDLNKLCKQSSVEELDSLLDDALWNTSVQPLAYEEEVKNEYKDITIDEHCLLPKVEPSWSYEDYENTSFEDAKSVDCTTDNENNRAGVQTDTVIQDCFVKLTRLPNNISYNDVNKSINVMDSLYDLLQSTNGVCEDNRECKNTREDFVITPNTNILLADEDLANGQNLNTETQSLVTIPIDSFNKKINGKNDASNGFSKLSKQTSVDELDSLSDDALWNISAQPLAYEEEVKNEYKDITIDEHSLLPKVEPSWSYEDYENTSFEDAKNGDCTTDNENNRASVQTDTVIQDCFVKLTRLPNNISYNNINKGNYKGDCNFRSARKSRLKQHLGIHTGENPLVCNVWDYRAAQKRNLKEHLKIHTGEKPFACTVCDYRSAAQSDLRGHRRIHTGEKPFVCKVCDYRFACKSSLKDHLKMHTGEKPFSCNVCDYRSAQKSSLKAHLKFHTGEKPFVCNVCDYRSAVQSALQRHLRIHTGEKPFACTVCDYRSAQKINLREHQKIHTGEKPFACTVCDYRSAQKINLREHQKIHTGEKPFACTVCDYRSAQKTNLKEHQKIHTGEKPFACTVCDYRSAQKTKLKEHLKMHTGEKPFACNVCDYRSAQKSSLKTHLKFHIGEKPFVCNVCDYRSAVQSALRRHLRIHTGEKPFACNVCDYRSTQKTQLKEHLKIHTGEKPFACTVCDYRSAQKRYLKEHLKIHTGEKLFTCTVCDYCSAQKTNLKKHLKNSHW